MAAPTWTAGQVLTASDVNTWLAPRCAVKTADENLTTDTVLQNDDHLSVAVAANATYMCYLHMLVTSPAAADFKLNLVRLASSTFDGDLITVNAAATAFDDSFDVREAGTGDVAPKMSGSQQSLKINGIYRTAGTSGNMVVRWAQLAASGTTTVHSGSTLLLIRVA